MIPESVRDKVYYEEDGIVLLHGDCLEILPEFEKDSVDLVLTDPPYGIGMDGGNVGYKGFNSFEKLGWDKVTPPQKAFDLIIEKSDIQIIWGGNYFNLPPSRCFFVWDKGAGFKGRTYAECEIAWVSKDANAKIFSYDPLAKGDYKGKHHPTMKPLELIKWCLNFIPDASLILDPFLGSGTTAVAAKQLGRKCIGIELEQKYLDIAVERLRQGVLL